MNKIQLRPRQKQMVDKALKALNHKQNTLCVAPTGAGKTIMMASIVGEYIKKGRERFK